MFGQITQARPDRIERLGAVVDDPDVMTGYGKLLERCLADAAKHCVPEWLEAILDV